MLSGDALHALVAQLDTRYLIDTLVELARIPEPLGHGLVAFEIDQDCPIGLAFPQGEIIDAQDGGGGTRRDRQRAEQAQQRIAAGRQPEVLAQQRARGSPERAGNRPKALQEPLGPSCPGSQQLGEALGKNAAGAAPIHAEKLAAPEL